MFLGTVRISSIEDTVSGVFRERVDATYDVRGVGRDTTSWAPSAYSCVCRKTSAMRKRSRRRRGEQKLETHAGM
jgi:hypothetical protein